MVSRLEVNLSKEVSIFQIVDEFDYPLKRVYFLHQNFVESLIVNAHAPIPIFIWNEDNWTSTRRGDGSDVNFVDQILDISMNLFILDNGSYVNRCIR